MRDAQTAAGAQGQRDGGASAEVDTDIAEAELLEESVTYSLFATFGVNRGSDYSEYAAANEAVRALEEFNGVLAEIFETGVTLRGIYDLTAGFSVDPAVLLWLRSPNPDDLQWSYRQLLRVFSRYFQTGPSSVQLTFELTELEEEPGGWLSIAAAIGREPAGESLPHRGEFATIGEGGHPRHAEAAFASELDGELGDEDAAAVVSLHAVVGVGEERYTVVAEADSAHWLIGDPTEPLGEAIGVIGNLGTGRWVTAAEVFEVLR